MPFDRDTSPIAGEGLRRIAELYRIEAEIAGQAPERQRTVRQERSKPLGPGVRSLAHRGPCQVVAEVPRR
ncbi:IS66 family transposase [Benzoatithermus flavus]|uniref:IS66 family transposase n=1 Tax=Benzoatithermus flavus TaxID=3108223 RepID=UPI003AB07652